MRIKPIKLNILGSMWSVIGKSAEEDKRLRGLSGMTDFSVREIVITDAPTEEYTIVDQHEDMQRTIRHELIHAFLAESGLWVNSGQVENWAMNEEMVDWLALQFPKIHAAMAEANALPGMRLVMD